MMRFALFLVFLIAACDPLPAETVGDVLMQQKSSSGKLVERWLTLQNGQVVGQTDGVPAPVTVVPFASPAFTGTPTAPTASGGTNTTQVATTEFVQAALAASGGSITNPTVAYVQTNGDDTSGTVGRPDKPFLTPLAAYNAGANVFIFGAGTFGGISGSTHDIALIGVGANKTFIGDIIGTSGSIYGNGQDMICINGNITIQPANGTNGDIGNSSDGQAPVSGGNGVDAPSVTVAGLKLADGDIVLVAGNGGTGGYGGDVITGQTALNGANGGNGGNAGTLTVRNCNLGGGYWVSIAGAGGDAGQGSNFTDNSNLGVPGTGGNGGNGGTAGAVIVYNSIGGGSYAAPANGGNGGAAGTGLNEGTPGNAGTAGGAGSITTYFTQCPNTVANGETTNYICSYINGVFTSPPPSSIGGQGSADSGKLAAFGSNGSLTASGYAAESQTGSTSLINPHYFSFLNNALSIYIKPPATITTGGNIFLPNITADAILISNNDTGTVTNGMLAGSIVEGKFAFTDITTGNASTTKHGFAPKLDGNSAHYLNGNGGWTTPSSGTVTSVAASVPSFLSISGSPITTSGTLAITLSGTALPVANGGTGQTTSQAAINALMAASGALSQGDVFYFNGTNVVRLAAGTSGQFLKTQGASANPIWASAGSVTSVGQSFTGGLISVSGSPVTSSGTLALTVAGTSGGIPYFSSNSAWASSAALAANALVIGGGAGAAPSTITTGTGVLTALGANVGSAGAFVINGGALGTPSGGTLTSCTGLPAAGVVGTAAVLGANTFTGVQTLPSTGSASATSFNFGTAGTGLFGGSTSLNISAGGTQMISATSSQVNIGSASANSIIFNGPFIYGAYLGSTTGRPNINMTAAYGSSVVFSVAGISSSDGFGVLAGGGAQNVNLFGSFTSNTAYTFNLKPCDKDFNGTYTGAGHVMAINGGKGSSVTTGGSGGNVTITGGSASGSGNNNGGSVVITGGAATGTGTAGGAIIGSNGSAIKSIKRATGTLVAGTVTISDTDTTDNSHISATVSSPGGTAGFLRVTVTAGTGYVINSSSSTDTSALVIKATHFQ